MIISQKFMLSMHFDKDYLSVVWLNIYGTHSYSCSQSFLDLVERGAVEFLAVTLLLRLGGFGGGISLPVVSLFSIIFTEPNG